MALSIVCSLLLFLTLCSASAAVNTTVVNAPGGAPANQLISPWSVLFTNDYIISKNKKFKLVMQNDCNLVLYNATWASGSFDRMGGCSFRIMGTGNGEVRNTPHKVIWETRTYALGYKDPYTMTLRNDGNLVLESKDGLYMWVQGCTRQSEPMTTFINAVE